MKSISGVMSGRFRLMGYPFSMFLSWHLLYYFRTRTSYSCGEWLHLFEVSGRISRFPCKVPSHPRYLHEFVYQQVAQHGSLRSLWYCPQQMCHRSRMYSTEPRSRKANFSKMHVNCMLTAQCFNAFRPAFVLTVE